MSGTRTAVVNTADPTLHAALRLAFVFAAIKLALHIAANVWESHIGYGYFRDEMYYLICGRHLAWGYVDHGPLVALQARASEVFFGHSLTGLRLLSAFAGAARVFLTGVLAWALGGRRPAQGLAMLGVLLTPQRKLLATRWALVGILVMIAIALPNLIWQVRHHWPTLEFLENGRRGNKNIQFGPLGFTLKQLLNMGPLLVFLGLQAWFTCCALKLPVARHHLWTLLRVDEVLHAKDYYVSPIYPILFAAGGIAWETRFSGRPLVISNRALAFPIYEAVLIAGAIFVLPLSLPLMPPVQWLAYTKSTRLDRFSGNSETSSSGPLPQFYADRFGWQEEVDQVTRIYDALPPEQRKVTGILCSNYGEASAINFLGRSLPFSISGHNNYDLWGPHGYSFDSMIAIEGTPEYLGRFLNSVQIVRHTGTTYSIPFEHRTIYLVRGRKVDVAMIWLDQKHFF